MKHGIRETVLHDDDQVVSQENYAKVRVLLGDAVTNNLQRRADAQFTYIIWADWEFTPFPDLPEPEHPSRRSPDYTMIANGFLGSCFAQDNEFILLSL